MYEATLQLPPPASSCGVIRCRYNFEQATASNKTVMLSKHLHDQGTSPTELPEFADIVHDVRSFSLSDNFNGFVLGAFKLLRAAPPAEGAAQAQQPRAGGRVTKSPKVLCTAAYNCNKHQSINQSGCQPKAFHQDKV
jgi:hypothetical protein